MKKRVKTDVSLSRWMRWNQSPRLIQTAKFSSFLAEARPTEQCATERQFVGFHIYLLYVQNFIRPMGFQHVYLLRCHQAQLMQQKKHMLEDPCVEIDESKSSCTFRPSLLP